MPSAAERALPESAENVQCHHSGLNDYVRLIKANMPREDFENYARSLKLSRRYNPSKHKKIEGLLNVGIGDAPPWWDPPDANETTYFEHTEGHEYVRFLKYHNGRVYYMELKW